MSDVIKTAARAIVGYMNEDIDDAEHVAQAAIAALEANGWAVVPVEPTEDMLQGACKKHKPGLPAECGGRGPRSRLGE